MTTKPIIFMLCLVLISCGSGGDEPSGSGVIQEPPDLSHTTPPQNGLRDWLTHDELNALNVGKNSVYHNSYFMPVGESQSALHPLNDTLNISGGFILGFPSEFDDNKLANRFPTISVTVFTHGDYLVPIQRDILVPEGQHKQWRVIFSPGKVWSESGDLDMSRASFPFTLVERSWNNALNGIATFLFDNDRVSNIRIQIVQHTSSGFIHEGAAILPMTRENIEPNDVDVLSAQFEQELANQLPVKSWIELKADYPDIDFDQFNDTISDTDVSTSAIWHNNAVYLQNCNTKYGEYPYCRFMRHGIYSATKSATGAVGLAFVAQRYGKEILDENVADYLPMDTLHEGWHEVTFANLLNMAAGIGNNDPDPLSTNYHADENAVPMGQWTRAPSAEKKLSIATTKYGNFPWAPGEVFRYNTTHTFVLSAAMNGLVNQREGKDLWPLMMEEVYRPIGISHLPKMHTTEDDNLPGIPIMGIGLYPTVDEAIKIARLLHHHGKHQGRQILHTDVVASMLYRTQNKGFNAVHENNQYGSAKYHMSFWGTPYKQGDCFFHVPFMNGYGGNLVGILPNGVVVLRFTDAGNYRTLSMIDVAFALSPVCQNPEN